MSSNYAMGLDVRDRGGRRAITHGGGINGYLSDVQYYPDDELLIVVLQNSTGPIGARTLGATFADLVLGPVPSPKPVPFTGELDALVGEYAGPTRGSRLHMTVTRDGAQLVFAASGQETGVRPVHVGDGVWVDGDSRLWFVLSDGRATELRLEQGCWTLRSETRQVNCPGSDAPAQPNGNASFSCHKRSTKTHRRQPASTGSPIP